MIWFELCKRSRLFKYLPASSVTAPAASQALRTAAAGVFFDSDHTILSIYIIAVLILFSVQYNFPTSFKDDLLRSEDFDLLASGTEFNTIRTIFSVSCVNAVSP